MARAQSGVRKQSAKAVQRTVRKPAAKPAKAALTTPVKSAAKPAAKSAVKSAVKAPKPTLKTQRSPAKPAAKFAANTEDAIFDQQRRDLQSQLEGLQRFVSHASTLPVAELSGFLAKAAASVARDPLPTVREIDPSEEELREEMGELVLHHCMTRVYGEKWAGDLQVGLSYYTLFSDAKVVGAFNEKGKLVGACAYYLTEPKRGRKKGIEIGVVGALPGSRAGGVIARYLQNLVRTDDDLHYIVIDSMQVMKKGVTVPGKQVNLEQASKTYDFWAHLGFTPVTDELTRHRFIWKLTKPSGNKEVPSAVANESPWNTDRKMRTFLGMVHATTLTPHLTPMVWVP